MCIHNKGVADLVWWINDTEQQNYIFHRKVYKLSDLVWLAGTAERLSI